MIKSIFAGIFIGLAAIISGYSPYPELLFAVGLVLVIFTGSNLYTGKVGHTPIADWKFLLTVIIGNFIGISAIALYAKLFLNCTVFITAAALKISTSYIRLIFSSILCGSLMTIATSLNTKKNYLIVICCILAFMTCKFDHSIANMFYYWFAPFSIHSILKIMIMIIGNGIGGKLTYLTFKEKI